MEVFLFVLPAEGTLQMLHMAVILQFESSCLFVQYVISVRCDLVNMIFLYFEFFY